MSQLRSSDAPTLPTPYADHRATDAAPCLGINAVSTHVQSARDLRDVS